MTCGVSFIDALNADDFCFSLVLCLVCEANLVETFLDDETLLSQIARSIVGPTKVHMVCVVNGKAFDLSLQLLQDL